MDKIKLFSVFAVLALLLSASTGIAIPGDIDRFYVALPLVLESGLVLRCT
ncbi:MAG: hypothetical protein ACP5HM_15895 [Anaerolineae bacterium]